jgi:hypothetical protein
VLINDFAAQAAARLNLIRGRDNIWRGRCPACSYAKPSLELAVQGDRIVVRCTACDAHASIALQAGTQRPGEQGLGGSSARLVIICCYPEASAHVKLPARGKNDFNDLLMSA